MKRCLLLLLGLGFVVALEAQTEDFSFFKNLFWQQLSGQCAPGLRWEKTVITIAEDGSEQAETKVWNLDCLHGTMSDGTQSQSMNLDEFAFLFEFAYDNPYLSDQLNVMFEPGLVEATAKPDASECKLRLQRFEVNTATNLLRRAHSKIQKSSPLYDLDVDIVVEFDLAGHYQSHSIHTRTDVLLGGTIETKVSARMLP